MKKEERSLFAIHLDNQSTPPLKLHKCVHCEMLKLYIYLPSCQVLFLLLSISLLLHAQAFWDSASRGQCQILPVTAEQQITAVLKSCSLLLPTNASPAQPSLSPPQLHQKVLHALPPFLDYRMALWSVLSFHTTDHTWIGFFVVVFFIIIF